MADQNQINRNIDDGSKLRKPASLMGQDVLQLAHVDRHFEDGSIPVAKLAAAPTPAAHAATHEDGGSDEIQVENLPTTETNAGYLLQAVGDGSVAFAAPAGSATLSDYQNVIVVDQAGNGDFTSLKSAVDSVSGATASNRYAILVFGQVSETLDITMKDYVSIIGMGNARIVSVRGMVFPNTLVGDIEVSNLRWETSGTDTITLQNFAATTSIVFNNCQLIHTSSGAGSQLIDSNGGFAEFNNCLLETNANAIPVVYYHTTTPNGRTFFRNCTLRVDGAHNSAQTMYFPSNLAVDITFYNCEILTATGTNPVILWTDTLLLDVHFMGCTIRYRGSGGSNGVFRSNTGAGNSTLRFVGCYVEAPGVEFVDSGLAIVVEAIYNVLNTANSANATYTTGTARNNNIEV